MAAHSRDFLTTDYQRTYNRLPDDVDKSYARLLLRTGYMDVIRGTLDIIIRHDAAELAGVFLLHRHFQAPPDAIFLERPFRPGVTNHHPVLVTAPTSKEK